MVVDPYFLRFIPSLWPIHLPNTRITPLLAGYSLPQIYFPTSLSANAVPGIRQSYKPKHQNDLA